MIEKTQRLETSSKEELPNFKDGLLAIVELAKEINPGRYELSEDFTDSPRIEKALALGIKLVKVRPNGYSIITCDDLGERYSFAFFKEEVFLYRQDVSISSEDGKRSEWAKVFNGDINQLEDESIIDKSMTEAALELSLAILAVLDQLKSSKSA